VKTYESLNAESMTYGDLSPIVKVGLGHRHTTRTAPAHISGCEDAAPIVPDQHWMGFGQPEFPGNSPAGHVVAPSNIREKKMSDTAKFLLRAAPEFVMGERLALVDLPV